MKAQGDRTAGIAAAPLLKTVAAMTAGLLLLSCGTKMQQRLTRLDTPEHHVFVGTVLLQQEKFADAGREFDLALQADSQSAKAHAGMGLVKAYHGDFNGGMGAIKKAESLARDDEEKINALVGMIRVNHLSHTTCLRIGAECTANDPWFLSSRQAFDQVLKINPRTASAYYYMGESYVAVLELEQAGRMFHAALDMGGDYAVEAAQQWKLLQKIRKAMPETVTGRKIALQERVTRADMALLLMEELKLDTLYALRVPGGVFSPGQGGEKGEDRNGSAATAKDIVRHARKTAIEGFLMTGTRGLDLYPDGAFRPDDPLNRASYARIAADILSKVLGGPYLETRFAGRRSPFSDVPADSPCFPAVMLMTSRGIMEVQDATAGIFNPLGPISGTDALLGLRRIRDELKY